MKIKPLEERLPLTLLFMRLSVFLVMLMWTLVLVFFFHRPDIENKTIGIKV